MCSVVGYIGKNQSKSFVLEGLSRLEYRGYDSAGFACLDEHKKLKCHRSQGHLDQLVSRCAQDPIDGFLGIGHTRWSTHGVPSERNAHPQFDCQSTIAVVHNGIIENYHDVKQRLIANGHAFSSDTDTEVIAHSLEHHLSRTTSLHEAVKELVAELEGAYAFVAIMQDRPDEIIAVRKRSPLCIGIGVDEMFISSDPLAFAGKTKKVVFMPDGSFALVRKTGVALYAFSGEPLSLNEQDFEVTWTNNGKMGYEHFMLKEIYEQKGAIASTVAFYQEKSASIATQMGVTPDQLKEVERICLIGCGTSWHAARIAQFFFESIVKIPTSVYLASEFRYMPFFPHKKSIYIAISQSGETADTLEAVRLISSLKIPTVALTNVASSTMVRECNGFLLTQAGPEVAVASTKAFSTQITALYWLAHRIAYEKGFISEEQLQAAEHELLIVAEILESSIENYKHEIFKTLAPRYAAYSKAIFLGRHISYPFALEAALKLKEIAYVFAQCYPAGELKHGPIALIDQNTPVFIFSHSNPVIYNKLISNAQEVKARGGHIVSFVFEGQKELADLSNQSFVIPRVNPLLGPLAMTGLMQFFVYAIAKERGCAIDKPRNLAKSVTVE